MREWGAQLTLFIRHNRTWYNDKLDWIDASNEETKFSLFIENWQA